MPLADLCDEYLEAAKSQLKPNSLKTSGGGRVHHVRPHIGALPVAIVTSAIIEKFVRDVAAGKTAHKTVGGEKHKIEAGITGGNAAASRLLAILAILPRCCPAHYTSCRVSSVVCRKNGAGIER